ncbi:hypothetical protein INR49_024156 [Caranx melampygus]|nr:hypothetical protein INR49_024156 [Caranx melampygus]
MLCFQLLLIGRHRNLCSLCTSDSDCTLTLTHTWCFPLASQSVWTLGGGWFLHCPGTLDSDLIQCSGLTLRLCLLADRTNRVPATSFDWHQSHQPSAATSCLALAVPARHTGGYLFKL